MDVNEYMKQSLANQLETIALLSAIADGLANQVTIDVRVPVDTAEALKPDPKAGSTKQAKAHTAAETVAAPADEEKRPATADDVRAALMKLGKAQGSNAAVELLAKHGATSVSALDVAKYDELIADAEALS